MSEEGEGLEGRRVGERQKSGEIFYSYVGVPVLFRGCAKSGPNVG